MLFRSLRTTGAAFPAQHKLSIAEYRTDSKKKEPSPYGESPLILPCFLYLLNRFNLLRRLRFYSLMFASQSLELDISKEAFLQFWHILSPLMCYMRLPQMLAEYQL